MLGRVINLENGDNVSNSNEDKIKLFSNSAVYSYKTRGNEYSVEPDSPPMNMSIM